MSKRITLEVQSRRRPTTSLAEWQERQDEIDRTILNLPDYLSLQEGIDYPCSGLPCLPESTPWYIENGIIFDENGDEAGSVIDGSLELNEGSVIGQANIIYRSSGSSTITLPTAALTVSDVWLDQLHAKTSQYEFFPDNTVTLLSSILSSTITEVKYVSTVQNE